MSIVTTNHCIEAVFNFFKKKVDVLNNYFSDCMFIQLSKCVPPHGPCLGH